MIGKPKIAGSLILNKFAGATSFLIVLYFSDLPKNEARRTSVCDA